MTKVAGRFQRTERFAVFTLPLLPSVAARADGWPQWRGPNRDGVWRKTGILELIPALGLEVRWRVTLRGHRSGISAIALSPDDRILASASLDDAVRLWDLIV